ncbi:MAG: hypothetical protein ACRC4W_05475 [Treponemataceae bacterium]
MLGSTARSAGELVEVNFKSTVSHFHRLRELIFQYQQETTKFSGEIEVDESYFGGTRLQTKFVCKKIAKTWQGLYLYPK